MTKNERFIGETGTQRGMTFGSFSTEEKLAAWMKKQLGQIETSHNNKIVGIEVRGSLSDLRITTHYVSNK